MIPNSANFIAHLGASVFSIVLAFAFSTQLRTLSLRPVFGLAASMQAIWLLVGSYALSHVTFFWHSSAYLLDSAQQLFWLWALVQSMQFHCTRALPHSLHLAFIPFCAILLCMQLWLHFEWNATPQFTFGIPGLFISLGSLLCVNRLYCSTSNVRLLKLICVALGTLCAYNAYYFITVLTGFQSLSPDSGARVTVVLASSLVLLFGSLTLPKESIEPHAKLALSRPVILYIVLFSLIVAIITVFTLASLHIKRSGGGMSEALYLIIVGTSIISIIALLTSTNLRNLLNVLINKHLFSHKYDYRREWLKLISRLSKPANSQEAYGIALNVVQDIFKSPGSALYLRRGDHFSAVSTNNLLAPQEYTEHYQSEFAKTLREKEWVFFPALPPVSIHFDQYNRFIPQWMHDIDDIWLVMPLIDETRLTGFIILKQTHLHTTLNWEDLDLLKIIGRQIASYIESHEKSEALSEAKQFETFNKLSAFVMHDLKNLIAQQSLLLENAAKHRDNPAFIEDAFDTIGGSVERLNTLLKKLQRSEPEASRSINLKPIIIDAIGRCSRTQPMPSLRLEADRIRLLAAPETLCMILVHLVQNAQEATPPNGFVDVLISRDSENIIITIEDNGKGMDEQFVQNSLFKPFETTKTGKGMGIGVYQAKDYIEQLGGSLSVTSTINVGTTFVVKLPLLRNFTEDPHFIEDPNFIDGQNLIEDE